MFSRPSHALRSSLFALRFYLFAFGALGGKELLVTSDAVILVILGDEALRSQGFLAIIASEAVFMPLLSFVFHFLSAWKRGRGNRKTPTLNYKLKRVIMKLLYCRLITGHSKKSVSAVRADDLFFVSLSSEKSSFRFWTW